MRPPHGTEIATKHPTLTAGTEIAKRTAYRYHENCNKYLMYATSTELAKKHHTAGTEIAQNAYA